MVQVLHIIQKFVGLYTPVWVHFNSKKNIGIKQRNSFFNVCSKMFVIHYRTDVLFLSRQFPSPDFYWNISLRITLIIIIIFHVFFFFFVYRSWFINKYNDNDYRRVFILRRRYLLLNTRPSYISKAFRIQWRSRKNWPRSLRAKQFAQKHDYANSSTFKRLVSTSVGTILCVSQTRYPTQKSLEPRQLLSPVSVGIEKRKRMQRMCGEGLQVQLKNRPEFQS